MENFIEKLKGVDKKVWIGVGIGAAVIIILIIALVIGLGGKKPTGGNNSQNGTQAGTQTEGNGSEVFGTEDVTETIGTEMGTEIGTEMGTETTESESQTQGVGGTTVTQNPDVNGVTQKPTTTTQDGQELLGLGSKDQPYEVIPDLNSMSVTTVTVPAGKTLYYNIQRVGGMWLSINDSAAYVIEADGTRHNASNGKVGFTVESAMANEYVSFQIGNSSSTAKTFTIKFSNIKGTYQNPEKISTVGQYSTHLSAGNEVGYYYKYVAEKKGTIRFYIVTESTKCGITATNNRNSAQRTFQADVQEDAKGKYVEIAADFVEKGDEIMIVVCAEKYRGNIPAADVTWEIVYAE